MNYRHIQKVLCSCNMGDFDSIPKKHIRHNQEINVRSVSRYYYKWTIVFLISIPKFHYRIFINHNFLINCSKNFMKKPSKSSDWAHWILGKHLSTNLISNFIKLLLYFFISSWGLLKFFWLLLYQLLNCLFYWFCWKYVVFYLLRVLSMSWFSLSQSPNYIRKIRRFLKIQ